MWVFPGIFTITSIQKNVVTLDITIFVEKNQSEGRIVFWFLHFWKISKLFVYIWTVMLKYNIIFEHVLVGNLHFAFFSYSEKPMNFWENIYGISSRKSNITWNESLMWFMSYCRNFHHIYSLLIIKKNKKDKLCFSSNFDYLGNKWDSQKNLNVIIEGVCLCSMNYFCYSNIKFPNCWANLFHRFLKYFDNQMQWKYFSRLY